MFSPHTHTRAMLILISPDGLNGGFHCDLLKSVVSVSLVAALSAKGAYMGQVVTYIEVVCCRLRARVESKGRTSVGICVSFGHT